MVRLSYFDHYCSEIFCDGDVLERNEVGVKKVRKTLLLDASGGSVFMGSLTEAITFANSKGLEVKWQ